MKKFGNQRKRKRILENVTQVVIKTNQSIGLKQREKKIWCCIRKQIRFAVQNWETDSEVLN